MSSNELVAIAEEHAELIAILATVLIAAIGYVVNHLSASRRFKQEARLAFLSAQLERLYGPLYALVKSNTASYAVFRKTFRPGRSFDEPYSEDEWKTWRLWAEQVFVPSNLRIQSVIEKNAHLVIGGRLPEQFTALLAHVESTKLVLSLDAAQSRVLDEFAPWPADFETIVARGYAEVAEEHSRLLGALKPKLRRSR